MKEQAPSIDETVFVVVLIKNRQKAKVAKGLVDHEENGVSVIRFFKPIVICKIIKPVRAEYLFINDGLLFRNKHDAKQRAKEINKRLREER